MSGKSLEVTRYSDKDLEEFEAIIDQKITTAMSQLELYLGQIKDLGDNEDSGFKSLRESTNSVDLERLNDMARRQKKLIEHLQNAKRRIANKVYGVCRETGKLISKERLLAVPHATLSIEAKQRK